MLNYSKLHSERKATTENSTPMFFFREMPGGARHYQKSVELAPEQLSEILPGEESRCRRHPAVTRAGYRKLYLQSA